jgi:uncharacterized protein YxeA
MKKIIILVVVIIFLILCAITYSGFRTLTSNNQQNSNTPPTYNQSNQASPQTQQASATWHVVTTVNSDREWNTPPFSMQGSEWRITWSCSITDDPSIGGSLSASIASVVDNIGEDFANAVDCPVTTTPTYYYSEKPGQYYLYLGPTESSYSVKVEDYY